MIKTSLDWENRRQELMTQMRKLDYAPDLRRMLKNIDTMVVELSKLEVESRRTKSTTRSDGQLRRINESIDALEKWLMLAILMN
jgi:hypothetical protein